MSESRGVGLENLPVILVPGHDPVKAREARVSECGSVGGVVCRIVLYNVDIFNTTDLGSIANFAECSCAKSLIHRRHRVSEGDVGEGRSFNIESSSADKSGSKW